MNKSSRQNEQNQEVLRLIQAENERLKLREQELVFQAEQLAQPGAQERLLRDQKWLKLAGEENLELSGYRYLARPVVVYQEEMPAIIEQWRSLLW